MRKKLLTVALVGTMMLSLCACGSEKKSTDTTTDTQTTTEATQNDADATTESTTSSEESTTEEVASEPVDVSSLLNGIQKHQGETNNAKMVMDIDMSAEMPVDEQCTLQTVAVVMGVDMDIVANTDVAYCKGTMTADVMGEKENSNMESYAVKEGDNYTTYTKSDEGVWTKETMTDLQYDTNAFLSPLTPDAIKDAKVAETETDYVLTGTIDYNTIFKDNNMFDSVDLGSVASEMSGVNITITFDKVTKDYKEVVIGLPEGSEMMGMKLNKYEVKIINNGYSTDTIEVPEDVLKEAGKTSTDTPDDTNTDNETSTEATSEE